MSTTMQAAEAQAARRTEASIRALREDSARRAAEEYRQPRAVRQRRRANLVRAYLAQTVPR